MAGKKLTQQTLKTTDLADNDVIHVVDVSLSPPGTSFKVSLLALWNFFATKVVSGGGTTNRGFNIGNGQIVVAAGLAARGLVIGYNCTILEWTLVSTNVAGSMEVDLIRKNAAIPSYPGDSIIGAGVKPSSSSANFATSAPSGWTATTLAAGDVLQLYINSNSTLPSASLTLKLQAT